VQLQLWKRVFKTVMWGRIGPALPPGAESSDYYGHLNRADVGQVPVVLSQRDREFRSIHVVCALPKPFDNLVPYGASMDTLYGNALMTRFAQLSRRDAQGALRKAHDAAAPYLSKGLSTHELVCYFPTLVREDANIALRHAWLQLNLPAFREPEQLLRSPAWREAMETPVPVRRAWGVLGLFWALLLGEFERGVKYGACERCGRVFGGQRSKQFCGRGDDINCYHERRASDRQREREKVTPARSTS
jgi:hypothetical protein